MPKRISQVPAATSLNSTDYFLIERNTVANYKVSLSFLETSLQADLGLRTTDSPTFATVKCTNLTDGYIPYHVSDSSGLADSPIFISSSIPYIKEASTRHVLRFQSYGSLAHGITTFLPTNCYGQFMSETTNTGGLVLWGVSDGTYNGLRIIGVLGVEDPNDTIPAITISGYKKSGTSVTVLDSTETVFNITNGGTSLITVLGSGNVGIGTTSPGSYKLNVNGSLYASSGYKPGGGSWSDSSDIRIKEDIQPANLDILYNIVKTLPLKYYKFKDEYVPPEKITDRHRIGWIADDVQSVFPKAVSTMPLTKTSKVEVEEEVPVLDEDGNPVLDENGEQVKETKLVEREVTETLLEDCKTLDETLIIRALYGAVQKLIEKVENLEAIVNGNN